MIAVRARPALAGFVLILLLAFSVRIWNLDTQSLWHDEAWSVFSGYTPFAPMGIRGADVNAPFAYYSTLAVWMRLTGDEVWTMRYLSVWYGVLLVAVGAYIARRWFGVRAGLLTGLLLALSPILWVFSQEIRAYIPLPLAALMLLFLLDHVLRRPTLRAWLALAAVELMALYAQNLSVPLVAWLNLTALLAFALRREWRRLPIWFTVQFGLFLAYLPWLLTQRQTGTALNTPPTLNPELLWSIWQSYFTGIKALQNTDLPLMLLTAFFGLLTLFGAILTLIAMRRGAFRTQQVWLVVSQVVILPIFQLAIIYAAHIDFHPRYFILSAPATLLLAAAGVSALSAKFGKDKRLVPIKQFIRTNLVSSDEHADIPTNAFGMSSPRSKLLGAISGFIIHSPPLAMNQPATPPFFSLRHFPYWATAITGIAILIQMLRVTFGSPIYQHDDFRAIAERYAKLGPNDAIIIPYGWEPTLDYYSRKLNFRAKFVEMPLHGDPETLIARLTNDLRGVNNAEVLTWFQLPADMRNAYPCLLNTLGTQTDDTLTVSGLQTTRYTAFQSRADAMGLSFERGNETFGTLAMSRHWIGAGRSSFCVVTRWALLQASADDWRIVTRLTNQLGWQLGQTDGLLLSDRQTPTSRWKVGDTGTVFSLIPIPADAPGDAYLAFYRAYSARTPDGLRTYTPDAIYMGEREAQYGPFSRPDDPSAPTRPPDSTMTRFGDSLYLRSAEVPAVTALRQGDTFGVTLHWLQSDAALAYKVIPLVLQGNGWKVEADYYVKLDSRPLILSWHTLRVPADARGKATLGIPNFYGTGDSGNDGEIFKVLGTYDITPIERTYAEPALNLSARPNAGFPGVGQLIGVSVPSGEIKSGAPLSVTLSWRASATSDRALTVFVHLRDKDGNIIAQSDAQPVAGTRPTTTWLAGEYITDGHSLTWNRTDYQGTASLLVGFYDQLTGKRVSLREGIDVVIALENIRIVSR